MNNREKFNEFIKRKMAKYDKLSDEDFAKKLLYNYTPYTALFWEFANTQGFRKLLGIGIKKTAKWLQQEE